MKYNLKRVGENVAVIECERGNAIRIIFEDNDDYETENSITQSLILSYEQCMENLCEIAEL